MLGEICLADMYISCSMCGPSMMTLSCMVMENLVLSWKLDIVILCCKVALNTKNQSIPCCYIHWKRNTSRLQHFSSHANKYKMNCELMLTYDTPALRQTGSRNLKGQKTLPTIWGTYIKLVTKYQISAINSCWEKCD
jgi:hypothetical protein